MSKSKAIGSGGWRILGVALIAVLAMFLCFAMMTIKTEKVYAVEELEKIEFTADIGNPVWSNVSVEGQTYSYSGKTCYSSITQDPSIGVSCMTTGAYLMREDPSYINDACSAVLLYNTDEVEPYVVFADNVYSGWVLPGSDIWLVIPFKTVYDYSDEDNSYDLKWENGELLTKAYVNGEEADIVAMSDEYWAVYKIDTGEVIKEINFTAKLPEVETKVTTSGTVATWNDEIYDTVSQSPQIDVSLQTEGVYFMKDDPDYEGEPGAQILLFNTDDINYYSVYKSKVFNGLIAEGTDVWLVIPIKTQEGFNVAWTVDDNDEWSVTTKAYVNGKEAQLLSNSDEYWVAYKLDTSGIEHDWDEGKVTKEATSTTTGTKTYTCKGCHKTKTEVIPVKEAKKATAKPFLLAQMTSKNCNAVNLSWMKVKGAAGYEIYFSNCDKGDKTYKLKKVKTIKGASNNKWTKKKLSKNTAYKAYVKAYAMKDGKKSYIATSPAVHAITGGSDKNYTNAKSVSVKKSKVSLKVGATSKITASVKKVNGDKKLLDKGHTSTLRYYSNDKSIAKVSKSGKITAVAKGSCKVYAIAANGVKATVKVTVK